MKQLASVAWVRRRPGRAIAVVFGLWLVVCAIQLARAAASASDGAAAIETIDSGLTTERLLHGEIEAELERARHRFREAHRSASSPLVAPLRILPVAGRHLRSFASLTGAAERVAGMGSTGAVAARHALERPAGGGPERVRLLRALARVAGGVDRNLGDLDLGPDRDLAAPLARRRDRFVDALTRARTGLADSSLLLSSLADVVEGPGRYLLLAASNAEMRSGSGMFLSAGTLTTGGGRLALGAMQPTGDLTLVEGVPVEGDLADRWGWLNLGREWRNLAVSPRFDATGPLAAQMWRARTGETVDGVFVVDIEAVRSIIAATGPVTIGGGDVGSDDVVDFLMHGQYVAAAADSDQTGRRDQLAALAGAAIERLERGEFDLGRLFAELGHAVRGRHVLAWSSGVRHQEAWRVAGVAGELSAESLLLSVLNRGGNKLDRFLVVQPRLDSTEDGRGRLEVDLINTTPAGEVPYIAGPHPASGLVEGEYLGILSLSGPAAATPIRVAGDPPLVASGPDGPTTVAAIEFRLRRGEMRTVGFEFDLPADQSIVVEPSSRLPALTWRFRGRTWRDDRAHLVDFLART